MTLGGLEELLSPWFLWLFGVSCDSISLFHLSFFSLYSAFIFVSKLFRSVSWPWCKEELYVLSQHTTQFVLLFTWDKQKCFPSISYCVEDNNNIKSNNNEDNNNDGRFLPVRPLWSISSPWWYSSSASTITTTATTITTTTTTTAKGFYLWDLFDQFLLSVDIHLQPLAQLLLVLQLHLL